MNRVCSLFNIRYPIIQAGMVWCSGWKLASAVSNAGGLGIIGSGSMNAELLRTHIRKCREATSTPFAVNVPLLYSRIEETMAVIYEEAVKIVFTSAGNPGAFTQALKSHGVTVVHVVSSLKFALKAVDAGVDAIVGEGFEAGGHNGREETTTICLIPLLKEHIQVPIIAAGGIATGRGMLAAMALGADGVQVGSRFAAATESSAHASFKKKIIALLEGDTRLSFKKLAPVRLIRNAFADLVFAAEANGATLEELSALLGRGRAKLGMYEGDLDNGELEIGQASVLINAVEPAKDIIDSILSEYNEAKAELKDISSEH